MNRTEQRWKSPWAWALLALVLVAAVTNDRQETQVRRVTVTLTSSAAGAATQAISYSGTAGMPQFIAGGELLRCSVVPGTGGDAPTDNFTMYVYDDGDFDLLQARFVANIDNANGRSVQFAAPSALAGSMTVTAAGMGDANTCTVYLYIRQYLRGL
jgi:hypothetical protein